MDDIKAYFFLNKKNPKIPSNSSPPNKNLNFIYQTRTLPPLTEMSAKNVSFFTAPLSVPIPGCVVSEAVFVGFNYFMV